MKETTYLVRCWPRLHLESVFRRHQYRATYLRQLLEIRLDVEIDDILVLHSSFLLESQVHAIKLDGRNEAAASAAGTRRAA